MIDEQVGVEYGTPIQPGNVGGDGLGSPVTRQRGIDRSQLAMAADPTPPKEIIQPGDGTVVSRNTGPHVVLRFDPSGVQLADSVADTGSVLYVDQSAHAIGEANQPPGIERTRLPLPPPPAFVAPDREAIKAAAITAGFIVSDAPGVPPVVGVVASDDGSSDPRDMSVGPQVISALPVIKKRPIVPVVISASATVQERAAAGATNARRVARAKKGKK